MTTPRLAVTLFAVLISVSVLPAQPARAPLDDGIKLRVVEEIGRLLRENYVFPDVAGKCAEHLLAVMRSGGFASRSDAADLAQALTTELQSISRDKHMRVRARPAQAPVASGNPYFERYLQGLRLAEINYGFRKVEILEGNVGYLDLTGFPPVGLARTTAVAAMKMLSNADAVIVDERNNGGGNPETIQLVCSYFFDRPTHLNSLYWRKGDRTQEFWTYESVDGQRMADVPLFVLTSRRTFSGGEEFAYNLKTRRRATLIGEVTGGGANPGGMMPLPADLGIFIPTGRAINPVTKTNWEGTGVEPDVAVPEAEALTVALEKARAAAKERREERAQKARQGAEEAEKALKEAEAAMTAGDARKAAALVSAGLTAGIEAGCLDEAVINEVGYRFLAGKKTKMAVEVLRYNVGRYPASSNVYDSLGEALLEDGQRDEALRMYRKALELDPKSDSARQGVRKLEAGER